MTDHQEILEAENETRDDTELKEPPMYRVILLNDDYTSMEFVVMVLETIFRKSPSEAQQVMLSVHHKGSGVAGTYTKEIAETKITHTHTLAREREFPLTCIMEAA